MVLIIILINTNSTEGTYARYYCIIDRHLMRIQDCWDMHVSQDFPKCLENTIEFTIEKTSWEHYLHKIKFYRYEIFSNYCIDILCPPSYICEISCTTYAYIVTHRFKATYMLGLQCPVYNVCWDTCVQLISLKNFKDLILFSSQISFWCILKQQIYFYIPNLVSGSP